MHKLANLRRAVARKRIVTCSAFLQNEPNFASDDPEPQRTFHLIAKSPSEAAKPEAFGVLLFEITIHKQLGGDEHDRYGFHQLSDLAHHQRRGVRNAALWL